MVVCGDQDCIVDSDSDLFDMSRVMSKAAQEAAGRCTTSVGHG